MTVFIWEMIEDNTKRRMAKKYYHLSAKVDRLRYLQIAMPNIADSLQERLDGLIMRRDSYAKTGKVH